LLKIFLTIFQGGDLFLPDSPFWPGIYWTQIVILGSGAIGSWLGEAKDAIATGNSEAGIGKRKYSQIKQDLRII
jgi:hypothetical protein